MSPVNGDAAIEPNETFRVVFSNPGWRRPGEIVGGPAPSSTTTPANPRGPGPSRATSSGHAGPRPAPGDGHGWIPLPCSASQPRSSGSSFGAARNCPGGGPGAAAPGTPPAEPSTTPGGPERHAPAASPRRSTRSPRLFPSCSGQAAGDFKVDPSPSLTAVARTAASPFPDVRGRRRRRPVTSTHTYPG